LIAATIILAIAANSYELLCTAGLPMVYTRVLTLNELSSLQYYLYLGLYNLIYIIPLLVIVVLFTLTMGSRKLSKQSGRLLKLQAILVLRVISFPNPTSCYQRVVLISGRFA
jgi:cytochrome c biogenesis protein CcdA